MSPSIDRTATIFALPRWAVGPCARYAFAWSFVGLGMGLISTPSYSLPSLIAFALAGLLTSFCIAACLYRLARHSRLIVCGAIAALCFERCYALCTSSVLPPESCSTSWLIGALIGGSSRIWQLPVDLIRRCVPAAGAQN